MSAFAFRDGILCAEEVPLTRIAEAVATPFYCYASAALIGQYRAFAAAFEETDATIYYGVKANATLAVVRSLAQEGAGADVVSEGELRVALAAGIPPEKIVFSGVGKTRAELAFALEAGIFQINVESEPELELLDELARATGKKASVAVRINPDVDARTHVKITTGKRENKFGVPLDEARRLYGRGSALTNLSMRGIAVHIGSQLIDLAPYRQAFARMIDLARTLPFTETFSSGVPSNFAGWNGLNNSSITTQAQAEASTPTGNASIISGMPGTTGELYNTGSSIGVTYSTNTTNSADQ